MMGNRKSLFVGRCTCLEVLEWSNTAQWGSVGWMMMMMVWVTMTVSKLMRKRHINILVVVMMLVSFGTLSPSSRGNAA